MPLAAASAEREPMSSNARTMPTAAFALNRSAVLPDDFTPLQGADIWSTGALPMLHRLFLLAFLRRELHALDL